MDKKAKATVSLCSMSFILLAASATSPALATIAGSFPDAPETAVASIATISNLFGVPFTIICGLIAGTRVRFRSLSIISLVLVALGGLIPFFSTSIWQILFGRAILGIGTGLSNPIISTLTLSLFSTQESAKQFSRNMMSTNFGAVIFQLAGGWLCNIEWRMSFLAYVVVVPVLAIVVLFLPEPEKIVRREAERNSGKFELSKVLTHHVLFWSLTYALYMMFFYPFVTSISGVLSAEGVGGAMTSAVILSIHTGAGVLGGYLFYPISKRIGRLSLAVGFCLCMLGYTGLAFIRPLAGMALCSVIFGTGYGMLAPSINYNLGLKLSPEYRAASFSVEHLLSSIGSFASPFVLSFITGMVKGSYNRLTFIVCAVFFFFATLFFALYGLSDKTKTAKEERYVQQ